jgi:hypothetical protein
MEPRQSRAEQLIEQFEQLGLGEQKISKLEASLSAPVADQIALGDTRIRRHLAYALMAVFTAVTGATLWFLWLLFLADQKDFAAKLISQEGRVVNAKVIMTLLGATTVQLGAVMVIMARFLFKAPVDPA